MSFKPLSVSTGNQELRDRSRLLISRMQNGKVDSVSTPNGSTRRNLWGGGNGGGQSFGIDGHGSGGHDVWCETLPKMDREPTSPVGFNAPSQLSRIMVDVSASSGEFGRVSPPTRITHSFVSHTYCGADMNTKILCQLFADCNNFNLKSCCICPLIRVSSPVDILDTLRYLFTICDSHIFDRCISSFANVPTFATLCVGRYVYCFLHSGFHSV